MFLCLFGILISLVEKYVNTSHRNISVIVYIVSNIVKIVIYDEIMVNEYFQRVLWILNSIITKDELELLYNI